jgi:competence protein ComEA
MGIQDRDYMRRDNRLPTSHQWQKWLVIAAATIAVLSSAVWLARDARDLFGSSGPAEGSVRVNINTATLLELISIPGIADARALQIVAHRPYASVEELIRISGIGPKLLEDLRPFVKVDGETEKLR